MRHVARVRLTASYASVGALCLLIYRQASAYRHRNFCIDAHVLLSWHAGTCQGAA